MEPRTAMAFSIIKGHLVFSFPVLGVVFVGLLFAVMRRKSQPRLSLFIGLAMSLVLIAHGIDATVSCWTATTALYGPRLDPLKMGLITFGGKFVERLLMATTFGILLMLVFKPRANPTPGGSVGQN